MFGGGGKGWVFVIACQRCLLVHWQWLHVDIAMEHWQWLGLDIAMEHWQWLHLGSG